MMHGREETELQWICRSTLQALSPTFRETAIEARFYRYIGLTHTIRRKGAKWIVRISDHCMNAPAQVIEAIIVILGCKLLRRKTPRKPLEIYENFRKSSYVESAVRERRQLKGRKHIAAETGKHYSLREIYREVNAAYFGDQIEIRRIGWGRRNSWTRLGHYDSLHHTITISPVLDSPKAPAFVVKYLVYHEMLHAAFQDTKRHHPPEFRRAERSYPDYLRSTKFLKEYCARRRK
jgi:hypothetical protein